MSAAKPDEPRPTKTRQRLRDVSDLIDAYENLYNSQKNGEIDAKMSDGMNTTLKGSTMLIVKLPMDYLRTYVQASIKKIEIPPSLKKVLPITID